MTNKLAINVDKTNVMIVTGKRLEFRLDFQPSVKFSDHELVSNVSSASLLGLDIDSHLFLVNMLIKFVRSFLNV